MRMNVCTKMRGLRVVVLLNHIFIYKYPYRGFSIFHNVPKELSHYLVLYVRVFVFRVACVKEMSVCMRSC